MEPATERRIVYLLCLIGLIIALVDLVVGLNQGNLQAIAVAFFLTVLIVATVIGIWRSGRAGKEAGEAGIGEEEE